MKFELVVLVGILSAGAGLAAGPGGTAAGAAPRDASARKLQGKKVVMIVAARNFRDEELQKPMAILKAEGAQVTVASSTAGSARGMLGATVKVDLLLMDVRADAYDAVVFIGGVGASEYWNDAGAHALAQKALEAGKVVAAICLAPVTLANAGLLQGRRATVWASEAGKLRAKGAKYAAAALEVDGKIVTADGPNSADAFGRAVARALAE